MCTWYLFSVYISGQFGNHKSLQICQKKRALLLDLFVQKMCVKVTFIAFAVVYKYRLVAANPLFLTDGVGGVSRLGWVFCC